MATPVQSGAQSATWYQTEAGALGATVVDDVNVDWDALPSGKLKDLLNTTYAAVVSPSPKSAEQVFLEAFAAAGGSVSVAGNVACSGSWAISGGYPVLNYVGESAGGLVVRIQTSYSASE